MNKALLTIALCFLILTSTVLSIRFLFGKPKNDVKIQLENLEPNQTIFSPLQITGKARGTWFFEASFPIKLLDEKNNVIASGIAQTNEEWMTENWISFSSTLEFNTPDSETGTLVLMKDNPSDLPENDDQFIIPIKFEEQTTIVKIYFGNQETGGPPNFDCKEVVPVEREIPKTKAIAMATIEELLKGPTKEEQGSGLVTSINKDVKIQKLAIEDGTGKIDFNKQLEYAVGGSCRTASIRAQIENTLKQFPTVDSVIISIDGRTEDILQP